MSSGERAKPPASGEERNPFDISRRPHTEVATEIAKRMAAWKQARGRSSATSTPPSPDPVPGEANPPHLSAPVQPTHKPEFAGQTAQDQAAQEPRPAPPVAPPDPNAGPSGRPPRAPFFASFSVQRAMPPAPSPKQSPGRMETAAEAKQAASLAETPLTPEAGSTDNGPVAAQDAGDRHGGAQSAADAHPPEIRQHDARQAVAPAVSNEPASAADADAVEIRAKARAMKARWMSAQDSEDQRRADAPVAQKHETTKLEREPQDAGRPTAEAPRVASAMPSVDKLEELSGRREPTIGEPRRRDPGEIATAAPRTAAQGAVPTGGTPDDRSGREKPMRKEAAAESRAAPAAVANAKDDGSVREGPRIRSTIPLEALDKVSGRREPTFGGSAGKAREPKAPQPAAPRSPAPSESAAARAKRRVELPTMQTRIEARRVDAPRADPERTDPLRADPEMAVTFPHDVPEAWQTPSRSVVPPLRRQHGTGWAIGFGAVLLIIGLTAPAALLQQERQAQMDQGQVAMNPAPPPPRDQPEQAADGAQAPSTAQAESAAAPQSPPASPAPAAPDVQPRDSGAAQSLAAAPEAQEADNTGPQQDTANPSQTQQAALGPVRESSELEEAPVLAPPPPWKSAQAPLVNLASRDRNDPTAAFRPSSPMVARPFVPEQAQGQVLRPPTVGTATVPIDGAPSNGSRAASVNLKPSLIPQLKPKAPSTRTSTTPREFTRKPKPFTPQSFDQMLQVLVETLGEGKPADPNAIPRSNERR